MGIYYRIIICIIIFAAAGGIGGIFYVKKLYDERHNNKIMREISFEAFEFQGLYEILIKASEEKTKMLVSQRVFKEWNQRIKKCHGELIKKEWNEIIKNNRIHCEKGCVKSLEVNDENIKNILKEWSRKLISWGIERDKRTEFYIEMESSKYYVIEEAYSVGQKAKVETPCWFLSGRKIVLERGIARAIY